MTSPFCRECGGELEPTIGRGFYVHVTEPVPGHSPSVDDATLWADWEDRD